MAGNGSADWAVQENAVEKCREWAMNKMKIDDGGNSKEVQHLFNHIHFISYSVH